MSELVPVTVFTITYDQRSRVLALLEDLAGQAYPRELIDVVVLDDGSRDGTAKAVRARAGELPYRVRLLAREHEADYLSARRWNECIAAASPDSRVLIQVDDVRVRPDLISRHVRWHTRGGLRMVTGAKFDHDVETWELSSCARGRLAGPDGSARQISAWTAIWGASLSYPRTLVELLRAEPHEQPYDERMTGWGFHEVELAYRATKVGASLVYDPAVGVFHRRHTPEADLGRAIDHSARKRSDGIGNERYVLAKHGLQELPRW